MSGAFNVLLVVTTLAVFQGPVVYVHVLEYEWPIVRSRVFADFTIDRPMFTPSADPCDPLNAENPVLDAAARFAECRQSYAPLPR